MLKKIFTYKKLSYFFQIAIIISIIGLLSDVITYRYFANSTFLKVFNQNLNNVSIFIVCLIMISQALRIFIHKYRDTISQYRCVALTVELSICVFLAWVLTINHTIGEKFIIFSSSASRFDHSILLIIALIAICSSLIFELYKTMIAPDNIDTITVPSMIQSVIQLLFVKYIFIFIAYFKFIQLSSFHEYFTEIIQDTINSLWRDATILGILIACAWIVIIFYYAYTKYYHKE